jgi:hypothetical protein
MAVAMDDSVGFLRSSAGKHNADSLEKYCVDQKFAQADAS